MSSVHTKQSGKASSIVLYRRLLFPTLPASVEPPPILPDASPELNTELYDFIALALRAYITPWWSKVTRYDRDFVPHVAVVIGEVIRSLEKRFKAVDLPGLLYCAVPILVGQHYADYRAASEKLGTSYASGGAATLPQLFHQYQGHMGIDADGRIDHTYIRHTLDLILHACLPIEDQESDAERTIIREVIAKVLVQDVVPMLCQPWFIHKMILDQLQSDKTATTIPMKTADASVSSSSRASGPSFHSVVIFVLSTVQYLSGLCLTLINLYKQTVLIVKTVNATPELPKVRLKRNYAFNLLQCVAEVIDVRERMATTAIFDILETLLRLVSNFTDRFLVYMLQTHVVTEQRMIHIVKLSKQTLFPNGYPGPPPDIPTPEQQAITKEQVIRQIEGKIPSVVSSLILGPGKASHETVVTALEALSNEACNAHLVLFFLDLIVISLFPEYGIHPPENDVDDKAAESGANSFDSLSHSMAPSTPVEVADDDAEQSHAENFG